MDCLTVLISSAGRRVELINCFRADARKLGVELRVVATDMDPAMSAACQVADCCHQVPPCKEAGFVRALLEVCVQEKVGLVVPTIDPELEPLARRRIDFEQHRAAVVVSAPEVIAWSRNKLETHRFLTSHGIPAPRTMPLAELQKEAQGWRWPVVLKPVDGSGSSGVYQAQTPDDLPRLKLPAEKYLAQEQWSGQEFTVNLFFDRSGRARCAVPHLRREVRAGEVSKATTLREPVVLELARSLGRILSGAYGPLCFQAIVTPAGQAAVIEVNPRFGGGYMVAHQAGAAFPRWLLEDRLGLPSTVHDNWDEGVTMLRYDAAVFTRSTDSAGAAP
jgi:carbamoyl-phosphate synthase large subunit